MLANVHWKGAHIRHVWCLGFKYICFKHLGNHTSILCSKHMHSTPKGQHVSLDGLIQCVETLGHETFHQNANFDEICLRKLCKNNTRWLFTLLNFKKKTQCTNIDSKGCLVSMYVPHSHLYFNFFAFSFTFAKDGGKRWWVSL